MKLLFFNKIYNKLVSGITVTQDAKDRTITNDVTVLQDAIDRTITPFDTVLSSAVNLADGETAYKLPESPQENRKMLVVLNDCDETIYIGHSEVSEANGLPIEAGKHIVIGASDGIYAVCVTSDVDIKILELK